VKQFGRKYKLILGNDTESIEITGLRVVFEIHKTSSSEPNPATIQVYNLNESHRKAIASKQYHRLSLAVGYSELRVIYTGDIIEPKIVRSDLDFITVMECGDGFNDYTKAHVNTTLRAGASDSEILTEAKKSMAKTADGIIELPKERRLPRGKVLVGNARDVFHKVAKNNNADWSIQDGHLIVLPKDSVLADDEGFVLSEETGMIGSLEKTDDGLKITCLLNPFMRIGGLVRVKSIIPAFDGDYKITDLTFSGDIMESEWHSVIICINGQFKKVSNGK